MKFVSRVRFLKLYISILKQIQFPSVSLIIQIWIGCNIIQHEANHGGLVLHELIVIPDSRIHDRHIDKVSCQGSIPMRTQTYIQIYPSNNSIKVQRNTNNKINFIMYNLIVLIQELIQIHSCGALTKHKKNTNFNKRAGSESPTKVTC